MKPFYHLVPILFSWLILSLCTCHLTLGHDRSNNIQCIDKERDALLQFKHGVTYDNCGVLASWGTHIDCCQWHGVLCSNLTGHVTMLNLVGEYSPNGSDVLSCLEGNVSPSLGDLNQLEHLNLSMNAFQGKIPHHLGNLSKLTSLDLHSSFEGYLNVKSLSWISRLSLLSYLDLSGADLSEVTNWLTIVNNLPSLSVLHMDGCQLSTKTPSSLSYVNSSTTLRVIDLPANNFNDSSILQWLLNLPRVNTQLVYLDLSFNFFEIPIPIEFGNLHSLSYLSLSNNAFQGSVFRIISKLCKLEQLYLGKNNFTDELSNVIHSLVNCNNKALFTLQLSLNGFTGAIPHEFGSLSSLRKLYLNDNQLKGKISQGIGQLMMLEELDVSSNSLEDTLTRAHFLSLVSLRQLSLSDNSKLVISINDDWIPPFKLDVIRLRSCKLGPLFPKWLQLQQNFMYFDVSNAGISDNIPVSFWNKLSSNLRYLNISHNQFYGILPNLPDISNVVALDLSSNLFTGVVPSGFTNVRYYLYLNDNRFSDCSDMLCPKTQSTLSRLDMSNNLFSGKLPDCWMNFGQLQSLHLGNNKFSGRIPKSIGTLSSIEILHLNNNNFSGPFPAAFENCTSLIMLNLGYNLLSGYIPPWIGNASYSLGALILRKNRLIGAIPESICQLSNLQILDLAINHLSGVIPNCIGNFTAMERISYSRLGFNNAVEVGIGISVGVSNEDVAETVTVSWKRGEQSFKETIRLVKSIDLSSNELSGQIPDGISILNGLEAVDLSKNKLSGKIPLEIGNLTALELFDLSDNHFTGEIPISLAKVTTLDVMNVSKNNLFGEIPFSTQLQSFDASSYAGNPGLCGAPLPSCTKNQKPSNVPNDDTTNVKGKDEDFNFFLGLYISMALGFIIGFWGVFGTLVIKTSWRHAYFRFLENIKDRLL